MAKGSRPPDQCRAISNAIPKQRTATGIKKWLSVRMDRIVPGYRIRFPFEVTAIQPVILRERMSITKRYFTSCLNIRSKASLIFSMGMTSTSAVMLFAPQ